MFQQCCFPTKADALQLLVGSGNLEQDFTTSSRPHSVGNKKVSFWSKRNHTVSLAKQEDYRCIVNTYAFSVEHSISVELLTCIWHQNICTWLLEETNK